MRHLRIHGASANREPPLATYRWGWIDRRGGGSPRAWDRLEQDQGGLSVAPRRDQLLRHGACAECRSPLRAGQESRREDRAAPPDYPFGERQYTAEDLGGHTWTFSESIADVAPEEWGGTVVTTRG